ncbi:MAG: hypothetical protein A3B06_03905 [Candidatus Yonathbacteria bacterium RIFCSPLOWO2_01_FULL_43_20]|nr:MAG: hypothetical protein A3B06_03905 [Candidatus Yonathbacteria bacterium RIFCSPLOWO2_01_FULL_43_20]
MVFVQERTSKGVKYLYLDKSIRVQNKIYKISKYLGKKSDISKHQLKEAIKKFALEIDERIVDHITHHLRKTLTFTYPFSIEDVKTIERMNLKYKEIRNTLAPKDWNDIKKRFVANFVFESNALEGNSLTLKNFTEIIFENKVAGSSDLREVYDAKNSYQVFSKLFTAKKEITEAFIIDLHRKIMNNIDERTGYKKIPNVILGKRLQLSPPEQVPHKMKTLLTWYGTHKNRLHPLELAFRFHHQFEQIHPFADGNGRVGRMLLDYILIKQGYYPIIIRKNQRHSYLKSLEAADDQQYIPLIRFALEKAKETYRKFFEVYYGYI